jgi:hypothetical protein
MLEAIGRALGPDILMMLMPPVPAGVATAAMVESTMAINIRPPSRRIGFAEKSGFSNHPNFFWV